MSDQTPNSSEDLNGVEPSMEDILASIRKIISDDEPVAMESPEDVAKVELIDDPVSDELDDLMQGISLDGEDVTAAVPLEVPSVETPASFAAEGESVDLNIDDVLAGLDENLTDIEPVSEALSLDAIAKPAAAVASVAAVAAIAKPEAVDVEDPLADLLGDLDLGGEDVGSTAAVPSLDDVVEKTEILAKDDDDILAFLDEEIPLTEAAPAVAETAAPEFVADTPDVVEELPTFEATDDVEMDALLDDILMTPVAPVTEDVTSEMDDVSLDEILADDAPEIEEFSETVPIEQELSDLDLVKSLMADLADDPEGLDTDEDLDALLTIPEVDNEAEFISQDEALTSEPEEDILGDILDITLEDELSNHPEDLDIADMQPDELMSLDDVLGAEQNNIAENALSIDDVVADTTDAGLPSLSDIAAAAEADAVAVETAQATQSVSASTGVAAMIGGAAALGAAAVTAKASESEITADVEATEIDAVIEAVEAPAQADVIETAATAETQTEHLPEPIITQETSMPVKAVKTDAILDDVTEAATAGAFAELNQVVEDKAVFNERGPRIGDLVQDALRPMLKEWLDANLKGIVERAVTKEVKRISQGK